MGRMRKAAAVLMTAVVSFVAVARGEVLCLCDEDPDDCGHACHECGAPVSDGISGGEDCLHLEVASADLVVAKEGVRLPCVSAMPEAPAFVVVMAPPVSEVPLRATSPPRLPMFCSYSHRLFPRS